MCANSIGWSVGETLRAALNELATIVPDIGAMVIKHQTRQIVEEIES
jgi:hypothetical protein